MVTASVVFVWLALGSFAVAVLAGFAYDPDRTNAATVIVGTAVLLFGLSVVGLLFTVALLP